jgi:hypothetical protein
MATKLATLLKLKCKEFKRVEHCMHCSKGVNYSLRCQTLKEAESELYGD